MAVKQSKPPGGFESFCPVSVDQDPPRQIYRGPGRAGELS